MKRVQHNEVKPGMKIKVHRNRWVAVHEIYSQVTNSPHTVAHLKLKVSYVNGREKQPFQLNLYERPEGYELHPQAALLDAQAGQRAGRASVESVVLRNYVVDFVAVDHVDNQGDPCGYCTDVYPHPIACNVYATVITDSGRTEASMWSTCEACALHSIDQVEDVDSAHTVTIERTAR